MERGTTWGRWMAILAIGLAAMAATGCGQQQLEERNAALQKQLEQALAQNAELQGENDGLKSQNQGLVAELDRARALRTGAPLPPPPSTVAKPTRTKPDFGPDIDVSMSGDTMTVTLPDKILFDVGKAGLKADSKRHLDKIAAVLAKDFAGHVVRVEGHTDNQPIVKTKNLWQDNWDLSCNRAMSVVRYLTTKGISPKNVYAAGFGFYKPVASNDTVAGRAKNRRVAIVVSAK